MGIETALAAPPRQPTPPKKQAAPAKSPSRPTAEGTSRVAADAAHDPTEMKTAPDADGSLPDDAQSVTLDTVVVQSRDVGEAAGLRLEVSGRLVEQARALAPNLPAGLLRANPGRETTHEAVLHTALRLGMASLAALSDTDDEP